MRMNLRSMLRRALSIFLACSLAWLPMASVAGLACAELAQADVHEHHAAPGKSPDQTPQEQACHSVCASCVLLSSSVSVLQVAVASQFNNAVAASIRRLDLPVQERPPRFI